MLIESQLQEMQYTKIIMKFRVRWKRPVKSAINLQPKDVEGAYNIGDNTGDNHIKVEMPFNSLMTEFLEASNIKELMQQMLAYIKT